MEKKYYLGLDMGTSSVGWAVTDENYNLIRAKGKDLWGVRLFNEAKTSADRRNFRISRRRLQREKARIGYLKELFAEEINNIDAGFYQRLEDSKFFKEDKRETQTFALFADNGFTDKDYYSKYPTVFHLRKELIDNKEPYDIRLVYLAILNMFKHRGHFLNANLDGKGVVDLKMLCDTLVEQWRLYNGSEVVSNVLFESLESILPSNSFSKSRKVENIISNIGINKSKSKDIVEIIKLMCGLQGKLSLAFVNETIDEENKTFTLSFGDSNFDEKIITAEELLSNEAFEILLLLKQIHDWGILSKIMSGNGKTYQYLSYARVDSYEKHQMDLQILKGLFRKYAADQYDEMFRIMKDNNYSSYVGAVNSRLQRERRGGKSKEFFTQLKKALLSMPECEERDYVLNEIEKETFLPKQLNSSNGTIPNQVHKAELVAILNNAKEYLDFLNQEDEGGRTVSDRIISLFEFQIPYYIGPLFSDGHGTAWVKRKETGKVLPWNFEEKIDVKASAEEFINRMVNHCTYLSDYQVLPKNSLLYEKYMVLNELNNLKINNIEISVDLKQSLYNDLFKKGKKVTGKRLKSYLIENGICSNKDEIEISGIDGDFKNTLSNYAKFANLLNVDTLTNRQIEMAENIIFWSTVYGESKRFLQERIESAYDDALSKEQIKRLVGMKFKDWGRFSRELLEFEGADKITGEIQTIMHRMWNENYNIMELLSDKFTYMDDIKSSGERIEKSLTEIEYEDLQDLYISAPVRRMVWQTILIVKDLYKVLKCEPEKVFIEMARDDNAKKVRTISRKKKFAELYKSCKDDGKNWSKEIADTPERDFRQKKLYLYYTQKGRCMYTGEIIDLYKLLSNNNEYDIDHIYPRHFVKDDSIENNLVLVRKEKNNHKSDNFPIEAQIQSQNKALWKSLRDGGFITSEKYQRLIRNTEFTDEERAAFINRQIVETRQGTKAVAELFKNSFQKTEVVYVKAGNVSDFRHQFDLIKCRDVNDYHHANDAYLNIVVGNTYNVKFTKDPINFVKAYRNNPNKNAYHMYQLFNYNVERNCVIAWKVDNNQSISIVKKVMSKQTPLITRMNYEEHGGFADQTIYSAEAVQKAKGVGYIPVKSADKRLKDTSKYGGFTKYTGAYFFLVEHTERNKRIRTLEAMPLYLKDKLNTIEKLEEYCMDTLGYVEPSIRIEKVKMYSLIKVNGYYLYLTGRTGNRLLISNALPLSLDNKWEAYIRLLLKNENTEEEWLASEGITKENNMNLFDLLIFKHNKTIYSKRPNPVGEKLEASREKFKGLSLKKQIKVILEVVKLTKLTNMGADLSDIDLASKTGVMAINKKITEQGEFKLINQSPSGIFENTIDLLTV